MHVGAGCTRRHCPPTHLIKTSERRAVTEAVNVPIISSLLCLGRTDFKGCGGDMEHGRNWCRGGFSWASPYWGLRLTGGWQGVEAEGERGRTAGVAIWPREKTASVLKFKGHVGIKIPSLCRFGVYNLTTFQRCVWTCIHRFHVRTVKKKSTKTSWY